ncbi:MAG: hypothetical protein LW688_04230 [Cryomorphaceae bacterium]|jgi:hypothetical protein|nr:hypothetical protein [Cryomorphaceae bacterium]
MSVQINIKALIEFNQSLLNFSAKLRDCESNMNNSLKRLGEDWDDDKCEEFKRDFSVHIKKLQPLAEELKRYKEHSEKHWIPVIERFLNNSVK